MKKALVRFINGFCYSIAITLVIQLIVTVCSGKAPMLPEFISRFDSIIVAFAFQLVLVGFMSGITSAGTVVFEIDRMGFVMQSLLFLLIMLSAWIPVSCIVWGFYKYAISMITTFSSIVITYVICLIIAYKLCKKNVLIINEKLSGQKGKQHAQGNRD